MIATPFVRSGADLALAADDELVRQEIEQVVGTELGELPWRPRFGAGIEALRHRGNDETTAEIARIRARDALRKWMPKDVEIADVSATREDTKLKLRIRWRRAGREQVAAVEV